MARPKSGGVDQLNEQDWEKAIAIYTQIQTMKHAKALPSEVNNWMYGFTPNDNPGIFSDYTNDIISDLADGNDNITAWIPKEKADAWFDNVAHLSFITAEGWDGSKTYMQHLADSPDVAECDFGPGADYQIYEYQHGMRRVTFGTESTPLSRINGMKLHKNQQRKILKGDRAGEVINNEAEWMLAMMVSLMESHHRFNTVWGNPFIAVANPGAYDNKNMYEGLDQTIRQGYVASRMIGGGGAYWSDPIIVDGITVTDPVAQLRYIIAVGTKIIQRMRNRGYNPSPNDVALFMTPVHWRVYSEVLAAGALTRLYNASNNLFVQPGDVAEEIRRIRSSGGIEIAGMVVPVITNEVLGRNEMLPDDSTYGAVGDIYFLTRYYRGMNILAHRYLDWDSQDLSTPPPGDERNVPLSNIDTFLDGAIRTTWAYTNNTNTCWFYGMEMFGAIVSRMQPLQAKFMNFFVPADLEAEIEAVDFTHQDYYPYDGAKGGLGTPLITGLGAS